MTRKLQPVYLLCGTDQHEIQTRSRAVIDRVCPPDQQALLLEEVDAKAANAEEAGRIVFRILEGLRTVGLFGEGKVVWARDVSFLGEDPTSRAEDTKSALSHLTEELKKGLPAGVHLVLTAGKASKRTAFYKACEKLGEVIRADVPEKGRDAEQHCRESFTRAVQEAGKKVDSAAVQEFIARTGMDTMRMHQEIEKLLTYVGSAERVTLEDVQQISSSDREALFWEFAQTMRSGRPGEVLNVLAQLQFQGQAAIGLLINYERELATVDLLKQLADRGWIRIKKNGNWVNAEWSLPPEGEAILEGLGKRNPKTMAPFRISKLLEEAVQLPQRELNRRRTLLLRAHEQMVTSQVPHFMVLETTVLQILAAGTRRN